MTSYIKLQFRPAVLHQPILHCIVGSVTKYDVSIIAMDNNHDGCFLQDNHLAYPIILLPNDLTSIWLFLFCYLFGILIVEVDRLILSIRFLF